MLQVCVEKLQQLQLSVQKAQVWMDMECLLEKGFLLVAFHRVATISGNTANFEIPSIDAYECVIV